MLQRIFDALFSCTHQRTTFPLTPGRAKGAVRITTREVSGAYVVCLDCGREFVYDWKRMKIGKPLVAPRSDDTVVSREKFAAS